jgi:hypothetical protein
VRIKARDLQAEEGKHVSHLAVLAFGQAQLNPAIPARAALEIGVDRAVADAIDRHALRKTFQLVLCDVAESAGTILPDHRRTRQLQLALQFAVVGEKQQPLGHEVQAAHGHHSRKSGGQSIVDGRASLGITRGSDRSLRFVEAEKAGRSGWANGLSVDGYAGQIREKGGGRGQLLAV